MANGQELSVTSSLHTAFICMRDKFLIKILWIDGVRINQDDSVEKGQQVPKMGSIYGGACIVRIFLGQTEDDDKTAHAMDLLLTLNTLDGRTHFVERLESDEDGSRALINLLRRSYWQRMWMFQEIVLSRNAVVHFGPYKISWDNLRGLGEMSGDSASWPQAQARCDWIPELRTALFSIAHLFISKDVAHDSISVLQATRNLQCKDPRDKLFALMGVCSTIPIRADYSRPVRDIYTDFTRRLLETENGMAPLLTAGLWNPENGPQLNLPSWVPDYRGAHGVDYQYFVASHAEHVNASLGMEPSISFPSTLALVSPSDHLEDAVGPQYMLATRGLLMDIVSATTTLEQLQDSPQSLLASTENEGFGPSPSADQQDCAQALFRAMVFDIERLSSLSHTPESKQRFIRLVLGFAHYLSLDESLTRSKEQFLDSFTETNASDRTPRQHYEHLLGADPEELQ